MVRVWSLRLFGLTALVAVGSFSTQLIGLHGEHGLMPAAEYVSALKQGGHWVPTLFWFSASNAMLQAVCGVALASCLAIIMGFRPRVALVLLWVCWLSLVNVCTPFLNFQWDVLLVEATFFFIFYASKAGAPPNAAARFVVGWLAAKVTFESGLVKVLGGDPSWRDFTALTYHWWTQPLPTWTSFVLNELPTFMQKAMCAGSLALELMAPLMVLGPFKVRRVGAWLLIALQVGLFAAGNYSYYNVLAGVLAVPLLAAPSPENEARAKPVHWVFAAVVVAAGVAAYLRLLPPEVTQFDTVNGYGAFAHMTKTRPEIIIEGSDDGSTWLAYDFHWKPGRLDVRPKWVAPMQPRLDWQMWFAALSSCGQNPFLINLQHHLLKGTPDVLALLPATPFATPPKFVRTLTYEYRFAPLSSAQAWWSRTLTGPYCPALTLSADGRLMRY